MASEMHSLVCNQLKSGSHRVGLVGSACYGETLTLARDSGDVNNVLSERSTGGKDTVNTPAQLGPVNYRRTTFPTLHR